MDNDTEKLRTVIAKATPGEVALDWGAHYPWDANLMFGGTCVAGVEADAILDDEGDPKEIVPSVNTALIVAAVNALPTLLDTIDTLREQLAEARARVEKLELAGWRVFDNRQDTFKARNGRKVGIQDDSGEKCWIVTFDDMADLERALASEASHD